MDQAVPELDAAEPLQAAGAPDRGAPIFAIELGLPPEAALSWTKVGLTPGRGRRARAKRVQILWHDTPEGALAARHRVLEQVGAGWRLIACAPGREPWLPLRPPPVLAEADRLEALDLDLDQAPVPVASFLGETRSLALTLGEAPLTARWTTGRLRGIVGEAPLSRLTLEGDRRALAEAVPRLADLGAFVPRASVAAEAIAMARGQHPPARHKGAVQLAPGDDLAASLALSIGQLVDVILHWGEAILHTGGSEPVHQMRVAVRRLRSLLSAPSRHDTGLLWQDLREVLRALARRLGEARDWDVFLEGPGAELAALRPADGRVVRLLARAQRQRDLAHEALRAHLDTPASRRFTLELALFASLALFTEQGDPALWQGEIRAFAGGALDRRLHKLRAAGDDLRQLSDPDLHALRKNAKRLRYLCELFAPLWSGRAADKFVERLSRLQEHLGAINDRAAVEPLLARIRQTGFAAGMITGMAAAGAPAHRAYAQKSWRKFCALDRYWK